MTAAQQIKTRSAQLRNQGMTRWDADRQADYEIRTQQDAIWRAGIEQAEQHWGYNPATLATVGLN